MVSSFGSWFLTENSIFKKVFTITNDFTHAERETHTQKKTEIEGEREENLLYHVDST